MDSPAWIKKKAATINSINKKDKKCCQCAITVTLNREEWYQKRYQKSSPKHNKNWTFYK